MRGCTFQEDYCPWGYFSREINQILLNHKILTAINRQENFLPERENFLGEPSMVEIFLGGGVFQREEIPTRTICSGRGIFL